MPGLPGSRAEGGVASSPGRAIGGASPAVSSVDPSISCLPPGAAVLILPRLAGSGPVFLHEADSAPPFELEEGACLEAAVRCVVCFGPAVRHELRLTRSPPSWFGSGGVTSLAGSTGPGRVMLQAQGSPGVPDRRTRAVVAAGLRTPDRLGCPGTGAGSAFFLRFSLESEAEDHGVLRCGSVPA